MSLNDFKLVNGKIFKENNATILISESVTPFIYSTNNITDISEMSKIVEDMYNGFDGNDIEKAANLITNINRFITIAKKMYSDVSMITSPELGSIFSDIKKQIILNIGDLKRKGLSKVSFNYKRIDILHSDVGRITKQMNTISREDILNLKEKRYTIADFNADRYEIIRSLDGFGVTTLLELISLMKSEYFLDKCTEYRHHYYDLEDLTRNFNNLSYDRYSSDEVDDVNAVEAISFLYHIISILNVEMIDHMDSTTESNLEKIVESATTLCIMHCIKIIFKLGNNMNDAFRSDASRVALEQYKSEIIEALR